MNDPVSHPSHYTSDRFPFECIEMTEGMGFNIGNMVKYVWRHLDKGRPVEDLLKASWYLTRERARCHDRKGRMFRMDPGSRRLLKTLVKRDCDYSGFWAAMLKRDVTGMYLWLDNSILRYSRGDMSKEPNA